MQERFRQRLTKPLNLEHGESETHPLQTPPVIHISRLTSRREPDRAMLVQTLRRVTEAYMQGSKCTNMYESRPASPLTFLSYLFPCYFPVLTRAAPFL
jgi:hypothetical protein